MTDPVTPKSGPNWLWITLIALLAVLLVVWMISPSGDTDDAAVEDPIVVPDPAAPDAGVVGEGLPEPVDAPMGDTAGTAPASDPGAMPAEPAPPPAE